MQQSSSASILTPEALWNQQCCCPKELMPWKKVSPLSGHCLPLSSRLENLIRLLGAVIDLHTCGHRCEYECTQNNNTRSLTRLVLSAAGYESNCTFWHVTTHVFAPSSICLWCPVITWTLVWNGEGNLCFGRQMIIPFEFLCFPWRDSKFSQY